MKKKIRLIVLFSVLSVFLALLGCIKLAIDFGEEDKNIRKGLVSKLYQRKREISKVLRNIDIALKKDLYQESEKQQLLTLQDSLNKELAEIKALIETLKNEETKHQIKQYLEKKYP